MCDCPLCAPGACAVATVAHHAAQRVQSKLDALEKQRKDLAAEHGKLDIERTRHVREVKLQWDYAHSPYNISHAAAPLKGQYVLMSMFGKGGFAAVRPHLVASFRLSVLCAVSSARSCRSWRHACARDAAPATAAPRPRARVDRAAARRSSARTTSKPAPRWR